MRSSAIQRSRSVMFGCLRTSSSSTSWMALPVASAAWAMRRTAWPPSRVRCRPSGPSGSGENGTPRSTSHSTASALFCAMKRAVCSSTRPAPASCVSRTCDSMLSSLPRTPTMPPWAQAVAPSFSSRLASTTTGCVRARCSATVRPASPAPTMTTGALAGMLAVGFMARDVTDRAFYRCTSWTLGMGRCAAHMKTCLPGWPSPPYNNLH